MTKKSYHEENIWTFDETAVWFDRFGNTTIEKVGSNEVEMFATGHDKQNITVGPCASSAGKKKLPYIIFRGKGNTAEDKQLKARKDIEINYNQSINQSINVFQGNIQTVQFTNIYKHTLFLYDILMIIAIMKTNEHFE